MPPLPLPFPETPAPRRRMPASFRFAAAFKARD